MTVLRYALPTILSTILSETRYYYADQTDSGLNPACLSFPSAGSTVYTTMPGFSYNFSVTMETAFHTFLEIPSTLF